MGDEPKDGSGNGGGCGSSSSGGNGGKGGECELDGESSGGSSTVLPFFAQFRSVGPSGTGGGGVVIGNSAGVTVGANEIVDAAPGSGRPRVLQVQPPPVGGAIPASAAATSTLGGILGNGLGSLGRSSSGEHTKGDDGTGGVDDRR